MRSPVQVVNWFVEIFWPRGSSLRVTFDAVATASFPPMIRRVAVEAERQMIPCRVVKASHAAVANPGLPIAR